MSQDNVINNYVHTGDKLYKNKTVHYRAVCDEMK